MFRQKPANWQEQAGAFKIEAEGLPMARNERKKRQLRTHVILINEYHRWAA